MCGRGVHVHVSCARDEQRVWRNGARCMSKPDTCHAGHIKLLQLELDGCDVADVLSAASDTELSAEVVCDPMHCHPLAVGDAAVAIGRR